MNTDSVATVSGSTRLLKHSSVYALGSILKNIIGFLMLPLYTRYLSPADYGVISLMMLMLSLMEVLFGARLGYALPKMYAEAESVQRRNALISTALIFMLVVAALSTPIVFLMRAQVSHVIFGTSGYAVIVGYFSFVILTQTIETHGLDYIRLQQRPWLFLGMNVLKLAIQLSLNIFLIVGMRMGVMGVALSNLGSSATMAVVLLLYTVYRTGIRYDRALAVRMLVFSWPMWFAGIAGLYIATSSRYYLRIFSSLDAVGLYALAERFSSIMIMLIWLPFWQYWMVESFKYHQEGNTAAFRTVFRIATAVLFVAGLGISLFAAPVIHVMSTRAFYPAGYAVPLLVLGTIFWCLANFVSFSFLVTENTKALSAFSYVTATFVSVLYLVLIPTLSYIGAALAWVGAQGLQLVLTYIYGRRRFDMNLQMRFVPQVTAIAIGACVLGALPRPGLGFLADLSVRVLCWSAATLLIGYVLLVDRAFRGTALAAVPQRFQQLAARIGRGRSRA